MEASGGWIYAIAEDDTPLVKIGYTRRGTHYRLQSLAATLRCALTLIGVVALVRDVHKIEWGIHRLLAQQHIGREWFYLSMNQQRLEELVTQVHGVIPTGWLSCKAGTPGGE
jgi:hypothetical protein